ncbi:MAG TPA: hypothetical protein DEF06_04400 [Clostridiales bacterium]|nr:hypothetical protein [Clostridiales bacterium]
MVDPTSLNEKKRQSPEREETKNLRAFLFSLLGALAGAAVCVAIDYYFMGNITGLIYLFAGMTSYAFYQYFVERKDQKPIHLLFIALSCVLAATLAVFISCLILYAGQVQEPGMNFLEKTFELYRLNVTANGLQNYQHAYNGSGETMYFDLSLLSFHIVCAVMALLGLLLSWGFVKLATNVWEKRHGNQNTNYSYTSRKKNPKRKRKHR